MTAASSVRVRFCPSPTGTPHVGLVRTALFNWAHARHTGGTFVFRIEDTDAQRDSVESYAAILDALHWLGLEWDEGPQVGGPHGPYRQSERRDTYRDSLGLLVQAGEVYESYSTPEEIEARHRAAGRDPKLGYDNADRDLTEEQKAAFRAEGRRPVFRLRMPDRDISFTDLIRGEITFKAGVVPDFVLARADGMPLYPLTNPVDDALMGITHVLRGEDLLPSTPRQIALFEALARVGIGSGAPQYAHLPLVTGEGSRKLSKRDPQSNLFLYRDRGFVPEGLLNYLALLGWSLPVGPGSADRDVFTLAEMVEAFDVSKVSANTARFDIKKAEAINSAHLRMLAPDDFARRLEPYVVAELAGTAPVMTDTLGDDRASPARRRGTAGAGAQHGAVRRRAHAALPVRRRRSVRPGPRRGGQEPRRGRRSGPRSGSDQPRCARQVDGAADRDRAEGGAGGRAGTQAAQGVRARAGGRDGADGVAAAVRVDGAARPGALAGTAEGRF